MSGVIILPGKQRYTLRRMWPSFYSVERFKRLLNPWIAAGMRAPRRGFNMPSKHKQTGAIMLSLFGSNGNGPRVNLSTANSTAINTAPSPMFPLEAGFFWNPDGTVDRQDSTGLNQINAGLDWKLSAEEASAFELSWTKFSGFDLPTHRNPTTENTWAALSTTRFIRDSRTVAPEVFLIDVFIRDAITLTVLTSQRYQIEAGDSAL